MDKMTTEPITNNRGPAPGPNRRGANQFAAPSRWSHPPQARASRFFDIAHAARNHWPEYLMEGFGLGLFMVSACAFGVLLGHPTSPVHRAIPDQTVQRVLMGAAMGLT